MEFENQPPLNQKPNDTYKRYTQYLDTSWNDPSTKLKPSELVKPIVDIITDDYPMIIDFMNIKDNCSQSHCNVDVDQPIFQPSPKVLVYEDYSPYTRRYIFVIMILQLEELRFNLLIP